jgi:hypothetical protein
VISILGFQSSGYNLRDGQKDINLSFTEEYKNPQFLTVYATIITGAQHDA